MRNRTLNAESYRPVEAIGRGMAVLEALGSAGWASMDELCTMTEIHRSSLYRITQTLIKLGYVTRREEDGKVALTYKVQQLGDGLREDDLVVQVLAPHVKALTRRILWPSDFASFSLGTVRIRYSTHKFSPMSVHSRMIGRERSLTRSALGKAIIAAMSENEVNRIAALMKCTTPEDMTNPYRIRHITDQVRNQGYACSVGQTEDKISAIALPVRSGDTLFGAINVIFFRGVMTPAQAAERYLDDLRACCEAAGRAIAEQVLN
jgi:IclR family mhp operon transcriptional activator